MWILVDINPYDNPINSRVFEIWSGLGWKIETPTQKLCGKEELAGGGKLLWL